MLETLGTEPLKDGREMSIYRFTPPEKEYAGKFKHFMRYSNNENTRSIGSRADGKYADCSVDCYFTGEIEGKIVGQVWYGWGRHEQPIANFGQVYVDQDYRGLGITSILMKYLHEDFKASPVIGAFCTCGIPSIANLYRPSGFRQIYSGSSRLYSPGSDAPEDFNDLSEQYYEPTSTLRVVPGNMEYRHEIDCLLKFTLESKKLEALQRFSPAEVENYQNAFKNTDITLHQREVKYFLKDLPNLREMVVLRYFAASAVTSYQDALFKQEDKRGRIFVALSEKGRCVGWSFCLSPLPETSAVFLDYELHPSYKKFASELVAETRRQWYAEHKKTLLVACPIGSEKTSVWSDNGFKPIKEFNLFENEKIVLMEDY